MWTEDAAPWPREFADLGEAVVEIRTFDFAYIDIASRDVDLLDEIERGDRLGPTIAASPPLAPWLTSRVEAEVVKPGRLIDIDGNVVPPESRLHTSHPGDDR